MAFNPKDEQFQIKVTGEITGEQYAGMFKVRPVLPHALQLEEDRLRREFIGDKSAEASARAANQASIFAYLAIRITEAPSWWKDNGNGLSLYDDNVVSEVYDGAVKKVAEFMAGVKKKAEEAKKELAGIVAPE